MAEEIDKYEDDIDKLIDTGKEKGYLTFGEVNDLLPGDINTQTTSMTSSQPSTLRASMSFPAISFPATARSTSPRPEKSPKT